ncbi:hypothetical protein D1872_311160 [compost metagenome]
MSLVVPPDVDPPDVDPPDVELLLPPPPHPVSVSAATAASEKKIFLYVICLSFWLMLIYADTLTNVDYMRITKLLQNGYNVVAVL